MEFKGTKGLWTRYSSSIASKEEPVTHSVYVGTQRIALCYDLFKNDKSKNVNESEAKANAKLISCAPDLLKELSRIFEHYDKGTDTYNRIEKLLKKATE